LTLANICACRECVKPRPPNFPKYCSTTCSTRFIIFIFFFDYVYYSLMRLCFYFIVDIIVIII
jgi:hypothetical protein